MTTPAQDTPLVLPAPRTAALRVNPQSLLVYGPYKCGKSASAAAIPDSLTLECEPGGSDFVPHGRILQITGPHHFYSVLEQLTEARRAGHPLVKRIVVNYIGVIEDWVFDLALEAFKKTPMCSGKLADIRCITDLPSGGSSGGSAGWGWVREELMMMHNRITLAAEEVIFIAHLRDRAVMKEKGEVVVEDVDISGMKARRLFAGQCSALGFMYRRRNGDKDELVLSFKTSETVAGGCRCAHLSGKEFVIGTSTNGGPPTFDWSAIFLPTP